MRSREALRPTLLGSRQPKGQSSCATEIGFLLPPASSAPCREGLMYELVKHLALIMAQMGVVVLASYHSSRAGFVHVVHRSPAATSPDWLSPGLCGAGCAVQGGGRGGGCEEGALGRSMRRQRRSAPCAWSAAVVLPRIHAQPQAEMMRPNSGVPPHSLAQGAACSARGAQRREPGPREPDAREQYARGLRSRSRSCATPQGRGSAAHPREAMMTPQSQPED